MRLVLGFLLCASSLVAIPPKPAHVLPGEIDALIRDAIGASANESLAVYAESVGQAPHRYETFVEAARRILAQERATKQTVDNLVYDLAWRADDLLRAKQSSVDMVIAAHRARFHARRSVAAVHYNLFKRGQRLAELLAAAAREKQAVAIWRDLVTTAESAGHASAADFRADLKKLEASLKELEDQCCPSDEGVAKHPVWRPLIPLPRLLDN